MENEGEWGGMEDRWTRLCQGAGRREGGLGFDKGKRERGLG